MADKDRDDVLEQGDIFFFYRPRVEEDDPEALGDVQRFHVVLRPEGGSKTRLLTVARKRLPDIGRHEREWGFVDAVSDDATAIARSLREEVYETKTRGERRRPAARPAGEGVYAIALVDGQMHLVYLLELPDEPGEAQEALNIAPEASFALSVKNPEKGQPVAAGLRDEDKADYPQRLQELFRGRRFDQEDLALLDYEGAEFVLIGAREDPRRAYDIALDAEREDYDHSDTLTKLRLAKSRQPIRPLVEGDWA